MLQKLSQIRSGSRVCNGYFQLMRFFHVDLPYPGKVLILNA